MRSKCINYKRYILKISTIMTYNASKYVRITICGSYKYIGFYGPYAVCHLSFYPINSTYLSHDSDF